MFEAKCRGDYSTSYELMKNEDVSRECPRCGEVMLRSPEALNAISRYRKEYVCSECGEDESMRDFFGDAPRKHWWCDEVAGMVTLPVTFL